MLRDLNIQTVHIFTQIKTYFHELFQPQCKTQFVICYVAIVLQWQRLMSFEQLTDKQTKVTANRVSLLTPTPLNDTRTTVHSVCPCLPHVTIFSFLLSVDNFVVQTVQSGAEGGR